MTPASAFERDIEEEPDALRALAVSHLPADLTDINLDDYERVVLTGMGASHVAGHPTWTSLLREGRPAWWVSAAQLLAEPELVTAGSLLWVTSQSGESGEVVALLERQRQAKRRPKTLIATTNDPASNLGRAADILVGLHFGDEAAVSTKSYIATLAAHERALGALHKQDDARLVDQVLAAADELARFTPELAPVISAGLNQPSPRFAFVANSSGLPTALVGALLCKEVAKVPAEGYLAGEFRHGPLELAGPGLVAVLVGSGDDDSSLAALGHELVRSGSLVMLVDTGVGAEDYVPAWEVTTGGSSGLGRLVCGAKLIQLLNAELAKALGVEPGHFRFGQKITASI